MRRGSVPFFYAQELIEGVRMDLLPRRYETLKELRLYSFRVASVVGGWLTELFGVHDPEVLDRAFSLGHAMQLTNILRDVGEDLSRGRVYLPEDRMTRHGVDRELLEAMAIHAAPLFPGYHALLEELMREADAEYQRSFSAIPSLPPSFQRPVAIASRAYQAIHDEIRRNSYDNLTRRASTSLARKVSHAVGALTQLRRLERDEGLPGLAEGRTESASLRPGRPQESPA
jgi:phytoene synthase